MDVSTEELIKPSGIKNKILWQYFAAYADPAKADYVRCLCCYAKFSETPDADPKRWDRKYGKWKSTSALRRHLTTHQEIIAQVVEAETMLAAASGKVASVNIFLRLFVIWITKSMKPIGTCEDKNFRKMCKHLNSEIAPLTREAVNGEITRLALKLRTQITDSILPGKMIALTCDHWTSGLNITFIYGLIL